MTAKTDMPQNSLQLNELIKALPCEINDEKDLEDSLAHLINRISNRTVPVGSLSRMWTLGSMQAKIAMGYLAYAIRSRSLNDSEKQKLLNEANLTAALRLFGTMGYLRGAIMKVGQMLANLPKILPQEFIDVLSSLHFEAPPMHYSMIREVFLDELDREPEDLFASFDRRAFAAASLGQVHRARLKTGEEVAVKIQYPNMIRTIRSDMRNLRTLLLPMRFQKDWEYIVDHIKDMEMMLLQEADYRKEAKFMQMAFELFRDNDQIVVPGYYEAFSSSRVLTMDYLSGSTLPQFLKENPSLERRNHFGDLISTALIYLSYSSKRFYSDPHPGNFLMLENDRLGFIDFGSQRLLTDEEWQVTNNGEKAAMFTHDEELCNRAIAHGCLYDDAGDMDWERVAFLKKIVVWQAEPAMKDEPFDFGDEDWFQRGVDLNIELAKQRNSRFGPAYTWTNRTILGHRTLMYMLKCKFNFRRVYMKNNPNIDNRWHPIGNNERPPTSRL
jgi:predicted unusual protein kinase regulating ubiquinone biosynthesis (AarF/ABC1/UbiB family)